MQELDNDELKNIDGGAAGYGNIQLQCVCGQKFLSPNTWIQHVKTTRHRSATIYYQTKSGKNADWDSSKGNYVTKDPKKSIVKVTKIFTQENGNMQINIRYPNGTERAWGV